MKKIFFIIGMGILFLLTGCKADPKVYTVTFYDYDDTVLGTIIVEEGKDVDFENPSRKGYCFNGWDHDLHDIKSDLSIHATYTAKTKYHISLYDGNTLINNIEYTEDDEVLLEDYEKEGYIFEGWFASDISLYPYTIIEKGNKSNYKLYARMVDVTPEIVLPNATYHFTGIKKTPHSQNPNLYVFQPILPSDAVAGVTNYNWTTSDNTVATVSAYSTISIVSSGYCVLTATKKDDSNVTINCIIKVEGAEVKFSNEEEANTVELCTVTFLGKNNETIKETQIIKGHNVVYPVAKHYDGYKFVGWDKINYNITEDTTIKAMYEEGSNEYEGKKIAILGDSISTYKGYIPAGYATFYPYATGDVTDVNQTWWMRVCNKLGAGLFVDNSYSGSCVAVGQSATSSDARLKELIINNQTPDVLIIYMGSNDCASSSVTLREFNSKYQVMLDKIKTLCPNTKVLLCTLPKSLLYSEERRNQYNTAIKNYSNEYEIIDLSELDISSYLIDRAHPNSSGMEIISNKIISEMLEND